MDQKLLGPEHEEHAKILKELYLIQYELKTKYESEISHLDDEKKALKEQLDDLNSQIKEKKAEIEREFVLQIKDLIFPEKAGKDGKSEKVTRSEYTQKKLQLRHINLQ